MLLSFISKCKMQKSCTSFTFRNKRFAKCLHSGLCLGLDHIPASPLQNISQHFFLSLHAQQFYDVPAATDSSKSPQDTAEVR